jgi:hypothetical protein
VRLPTFYVAIALLAIIGFGGAPSPSISDEPTDNHSQHSQVHGKCAKVCVECQIACDECARRGAVLLREGHTESFAAFQTAEDCATICTAASRILSRGGPSSARICDTCREACASCAKECERFVDDQHMAACAEKCRDCEKACERMSKAMRD